MSKYHNRPTVAGGVRFDSAKEANHYLYLLGREQRGEIADLELQPRFPLVVAGVKIGEYRADFRFREVASGRVVVQDVKSIATKTAVYRLKKKLVLALHNVEIEEIF